ncbi:MAG: hypothetical protein NTU41_10550 [Chloroflexi bacterium]|nr:hypothetical protein [Chloroflexota bacterium]
MNYNRFQTPAVKKARIIVREIPVVGLVIVGDHCSTSASSITPEGEASVPCRKTE